MSAKSRQAQAAGGRARTAKHVPDVHRLDDFGASGDAASRDAGLQERFVVRPPVKGDVRHVFATHRQALREQLLDVRVAFQR